MGAAFGIALILVVIAGGGIFVAGAYRLASPGRGATARPAVAPIPGAGTDALESGALPSLDAPAARP